MMCQEVIELMQRYLDRDLEEAEYRRMLQHLQQCPDCTELFERLVNLSHELESLPKVMPPFSLVDAIMPKLEQLDSPDGEARELHMERRAGSDADRNAAAAERKTPGGWRKNIREWISFPVFGGVVAAGLVVGFFLFGQQHSSEQDAGKLMLSLPGAEQKAGSTAESRASAPAAGGSPLYDQATGSAKQGAPSGDAAAGKDTAAEKNAPAAGANQAAPKTGAAPETPKPDAKTAEPKGKAAPPAAETVPPKASAERSQPEPVPAPAPNAGQTGAAAAPGPAEPQTRQQLFAPKAEESVPAPDGPQNGGGSGGAAAGGAADAAGTTGQTPAPNTEQQPAEAAGPKQPFAKSDGGAYGITAMPSVPAPVTELSTTDGAYKAIVRDGRVTVFDKQGKEAYVSKYDWKDGDFKVELADWSADYKLTYRVKTSAQVKTFVIAMKTLTEMESKP